MKERDNFYNSQLEAIRNFYKKLQNRVEDNITLNDAVVVWFAHGHAEKFREEYFNQHDLVVQ